MDTPPSLFDRYLAYIKNNRILAVILIAGTTLMAVASFGDALQKMVGVISEAKKDPMPKLNGKWQSASLANPYAPTQMYHLVFDFIQQNDNLLGSVTEINDSTDTKRSVVRGIVAGKIKGNTLSFYTEGQTTLGSELQTYKTFYNGIAKNGQLEFVRQNDVQSGGLPTTFTVHFVP